MLKTSHRENIIFEACLTSKTKMIIDNTNPTRIDRARYIQRAIDTGFAQLFRLNIVGKGEFKVVNQVS